MRRLVLILFLAATAADICIYLGIIRRRFSSIWVRAGYVLFAVLTDGAGLSALMLYGAAADRGPTGVVAVMWLVWLFFLTLVPKMLFVLGWGGDLLLGLVSGRMRLASGRRVRSRLFRMIGLGLSAAAAVAMIVGATAGRTVLRVEQVEVCSDRVPEAFDGYRIVQFSDVHAGTMLRPGRQLARLVETINWMGADAVINTGDLVNLTNEELTPEVMEVLGGLRAPDGVWSTWGNHDLGFYIKEGAALTPRENMAALGDKVRRMGWRTLSDRSEWLRRGADSILITGLDYPTTRLNGHNNELGGTDYEAAYSGVAGLDPFNVVMAHTPVMWDEITSRGRGDLTLSGHVHAMQTKLKIFGLTLSPAQWMYRQWSGKYEAQNGRSDGSKEGRRNSVLYVNDGIGCVGYPMRMGARGEITVITLKRCE